MSVCETTCESESMPYQISCIKSYMDSTQNEKWGEGNGMGRKINNITKAVGGEGNGKARKINNITKAVGGGEGNGMGRKINNIAKAVL